MKEKEKILGLTVQFHTHLFGKPYVWVNDEDGNVGLVGINDNDEPVLL